MLHPVKHLIRTIVLLFLFCGCVLLSGISEETFRFSRAGNNINCFGDNVFLVVVPEDGDLTIKVHDTVCVYRTIQEKVTAGENRIHWDGCGYHRQRLYTKTYTFTAEMTTVTGNTYTSSFISPVTYTEQALQYALPSADNLYLDSMQDWFLEYKTITKGSVVIELIPEGQDECAFSYSVPSVGGKIDRMEFADIARKKIPDPGMYTVSVYEISKPSFAVKFTLTVLEYAPAKEKVLPTGEIMPDRSMNDEEIWQMMMRPSVVVDTDFYLHQNVYSEPDANSQSLGTLHGQTQGLKVIRIEGDWALVGAWIHEDASYVEGWVPYDRLIIEAPRSEYGILVDKKTQTLSVFQNGERIDTLLISTGRQSRNRLYQETSAGCFLTGYHKVNFSTNGKKYDYVIQYDGGNLLHQTPYEWGQNKQDFTLGRGYLGAKASHACIRIQSEPSEGGLNAYWIWTHIPYHTRVIILDDPDERTAVSEQMKRPAGFRFDPDKLQRADLSHDGKKDSVSLTFGGNFTPGGTKSFNQRRDSFQSLISASGVSAPLASLSSFLSGDDFTVVHLQCLLEDIENSGLSSLGINYAPVGTADLFRQSSVEMAQLTDSSVCSTGKQYVEQTIEAAQMYVGILTPEKNYTIELKGHLFGFAGFNETEYLEDPGIINRRIQALLDMQCERVICLVSWGAEKDTEHTIVQEAIARRCVFAGADLVVGSGPRFVQGIDYIDGVPVLYSLGELLEGSTIKKISKQQGVLARVNFSFETDSALPDVTLIPILPRGHSGSKQNDYSPTADMETNETEKVLMNLLLDSTDTSIKKTGFYLSGQE